MDQALDAISDLLRRAGDEDRPFPPTLLFEEGWMLRLVLQWFADNDLPGHPLTFAPGARWFSEARLASAFLAKPGGGEGAENYTSADGVVGHFKISKKHKAKLKLDRDAKQFIVAEAKMFSGLSKGTANDPRYNQAARNVACMAEVLKGADRKPTSMESLAFYVLAPRMQLNNGVFADFMNEASLKQAVEDRVQTYVPTKGHRRTRWFEAWFEPTLASMEVDCLAWEDVVDHIQAKDKPFGDDLAKFYDRCLEFNGPAKGSRPS